MVVGCGRVGSAVALRLAADGWDVSVIDERSETFQRLGEGFPGTTVEGHALDIATLLAAGIERADAVVVATNGDNTNVVCAQIAHEALRRRLRGRAHPRPGPRGALRRARHADGLPDHGRDRHPLRERALANGGDLMYILIAGGGKVGRTLTHELLKMRHEVTLIEQSATRYRLLEEELEHVVQHGDATELMVLERCGIQRAELVVAVTGDDEDNIVVCQVAREHYGVERVIARVNDPRNHDLFDLLGIAPSVCATTSIMRLIEHELPDHELVPLLELRREGLEVVEVQLGDDVGAAPRVRDRAARGRAPDRGAARRRLRHRRPRDDRAPGRPGARDRAHRSRGRAAPRPTDVEPSEPVARADVSASATPSASRQAAKPSPSGSSTTASRRRSRPRKASVTADASRGPCP